MDRLAEATAMGSGFTDPAAPRYFFSSVRRRLLDSIKKRLHGVCRLAAWSKSASTITESRLITSALIIVNVTPEVNTTCAASGSTNTL